MVIIVGISRCCRVRGVVTTSNTQYHHKQNHSDGDGDKGRNNVDVMFGWMKRHLKVANDVEVKEMAKPLLFDELRQENGDG